MTRKAARALVHRQDCRNSGMPSTETHSFLPKGEPMNQKKKLGGGRRRPPNEGLIGRTEVGRILQRDRRTVRRYEAKELLTAAIIEADGVRWFDRNAVKALAARFALMRRASGSGRLKPDGAALVQEPQREDEYYPELRERRAGPAQTPKPPVKARALPRRPPPSVIPPGLRGTGARTEIRPEWWDAELPSGAPETAPCGDAGMTEDDTARPIRRIKESKK
jgi:hypothetical protein